MSCIVVGVPTHTTPGYPATIEEIKKEIEQEELTKPVEKIIDNDIGAMLNTAKIRIENIDNPEDIEKKLEQAVFAQSKGIRENQEIMERINNILEQISKEDKVKADETKMLGLTKSVSEITGIEKEKIKQIIKNQENKIKEKAEQELYSGSFKRKLAIAGARWGAYIGLGAGVGALTMATGGTAGVFGGSALAGIRMAEGAITAKILGKKLKIIENELKKQLKENQIEKDKFLTDIIAEIALNKQEEIDHRGEEKQEARNNLEEKREAYLKKGKWTEEKKKKEIDEYQEYSEAVNYLKKDYEKSLNDYLDERYPDLDLKEKEACVNAMLALFQNEENTELLKQEFFKKGLFKKGIDKIQKVLDSKWLGGKDTIEKKLRTVAVFAGAGYLARQSNTVKRILFTFAGAKVGSAMADLILKNTRADDILSKVKAEDLTKQTEISDNLFNKAKAQLMDYNFKKENPSEYAKLREEVEKIEKEKISKAEKAEQLLAENNEKLKNKILEKKLAEQVVKRGKITMQILGAGAGFAFGELFVHSAQAKANSANETDGQIEIKGDTNVTEDNATQENKEQKSEKILAEEKEAQGMKEFLDINIKRQKEIQKALDIFCNENNIDIVNEEKLTDEQAVEFFRNSINHNYKPENISVVLESHISDWGIVENKYLHSIDVSNIGSYDAGASDKGTEETETYKPKITDNNFEKDSTAESLKSPLVEFTDKKLESVVNKYSKQNHIDDINDISDYQLKGLIEELDKEKISQNSLANFLRDQLKMNDSEIQNIEAKTFEISKGDSIWTTAEKYLQAKYSDFNNLGESDKTGKSAEALKTYNIDKIKDKIIEIIKTGDDDVKKQFGLEKINNPDKITIDQLKNIKFDEIDKTVFNDGKLTDELSNKKIENIVKNNETLKDFFHKHPDAPRSTQNYQDILDGSGSVEKTSVLEIGGQTDETNAVNIEKFEKLNISGQRTIIDDLHNQSREIDKITNASEDAKDSLRKERAKINILKTNLIQIFNEQHQTEIKEYKNLNNEIGWMEKEKLIQAKDNLLVKGKEFYIKPFLSRYFGIFWDEEKWEKAKTLNMSEVSDKKHSDIANKKLLSHLSEIKKSFGNPLERETVGKYLERFEVGEAEKRFELNDKKENLEKLGKIIGRENTESENITDKKIINTNSNKSQIKKIPTMDTRE
ncbi:MAG: hypothetical protein U9O55_02965 [Patescibacteria group bacterium]|nr:hypothetical protein [Patescibacteria group bacterium]